MIVSTRQRGFTLVELLVTMVIMVAVFSVAIPQYAQSMSSLQLRKSTQEIAAYLRHARNQSITESRTVNLVVDADERAIRQGDTDTAYRWPADIEVTLAERQFALADEDNAIQFRPDGTATNRMLHVSTERRQYTIAIDWLTGNVKVL